MRAVEAFWFFAAVVLVSGSIVVLGTRLLAWAERTRGADRTSRWPWPVAASVAWLTIHAALLLFRPASFWVSNVCVVGSGIAAAFLIGRTLRATPTVVALAVAASVADVVSFSAGPTRWILNADSAGAPGLLQYLALVLPFSGDATAVMGVGDMLLLGAFAMGLERSTRMPLVSAAAPILGLVVALAVGLSRGGVYGIPFMAAATMLVLVYARWRRPPAQ